MMDDVLPLVRDVDIKYNLVSCTKHLRVYIRGLVVLRECRNIDGLEYIKSETQTFRETKPRLIDSWLAQLLESKRKVKVELQTIIIKNSGKLDDMEEFCCNPNHENAWLGILEQHILGKKKPDKAMCCLVFCRMKLFCRALTEWASKQPLLSSLNPAFITRDMTSLQQNVVTENFRKGKCQLLFATSVAKEGMDIQSCDSVIRYNYPADMISRVQAKGNEITFRCNNSV
jgi:superfamily II DNA/RNA helicase